MNFNIIFYLFIKLLLGSLFTYKGYEAYFRLSVTPFLSNHPDYWAKETQNRHSNLKLLEISLRVIITELNHFLIIKIAKLSTYQQQILSINFSNLTQCDPDT